MKKRLPDETGKFVMNSVTYSYKIFYSDRTTFEIKVVGEFDVEIRCNYRRKGRLNFDKPELRRKINKACRRYNRVIIGHKLVAYKKTVIVWGKDVPVDEFIGKNTNEMDFESIFMAIEEKQTELVAKKCEELSPVIRAKYLEKGYDVPVPTLRVKSFKSMWGQCRKTGRIITMNSQLAKYDELALYSVLCHEYAHFIAMNHQKEFYDVLLDICPEYWIYHSLLKK